MAVSQKSKKELIEENKALRSRLKELEHSETEGKNAQDELRRSKEFLDNVINALDDSFFVKDHEHRWLMLNDAACKLMGRPREELIGKSDYDLFSKEQADVFWEKDNLVLKTGKTNVNEERVTWHGKIHTISTKKSIYTDPVTEQKFITGTNRDITEHKQAEEAIRESEEKFRSLAEQSPNMIFINREGRIVYANKKCEEIMGYRREEFYSPDFDFLTLIAPKSQDLILENFRRHLEGRDIPPYEYTIINKAGERVEAINSSKIIQYEGGNAVLGIVTDITERKQQESLTVIQRDLAIELSAATELEDGFSLCLEAAIEASGMDCGGIYLINEDSGYLELAVNRGLTAEFVNHVFYYNTDSDNKKLVMKGEPVYTEHEQLGTLLDQTEKQEGLIAIAVLPVLNEGRVIGCLNVASHIAEQIHARSRLALETIAAQIGSTVARLKTEQALRESEEQYRSLYSAINEGVALHELIYDTSGKPIDYRILDVNPAYESILGIKREKAVGAKASDLYGIGESPYLEIYSKVAVSGESLSFETNFEAMAKYFKISVFSPAKGKFATLFADITDRKRMEERVTKSEELFSKAFHANPIPATLTTVSNDKLLMINNAWLTLIGFDSQEEVIGKSAVELGLWAYIEDREERNTNLQQSGSSGLQEMRVKTPSGRIRDCLYTAEMIEYEGQFHILSMAIDITERKKAEESIRRSEQMFRTYFELGLVGMAVTSPEKGWIYVNDNLCEILGYPRDELIQTTWADLTHPDDLEVDVSQFEQVLSGQIDGYSMDKRFIRKDGLIVYISLSVACVRREDGSVEHFIVHLHDITDRKKAEKALKQSERKYRSLVANIPDVVWTSDEKGSTTFISENIREIYGYSPEEIYSQGDKLWFGRIHPDDVEKVAQSFKAVFEKGKPLDLEYRVKRKDDKWIWIRDRSIGAYEKDGVKYADGVFTNITERKKAEQALETSDLRFRSFIEQTTEAVFCYEYDPPIPTDLPIEQQLRLLYDGVLVECNDVCAKSYGAQRAEEVVGRRLTELFGTEQGSLDTLFRAMIEGGYRIDDGEGIEKLKDGTDRYYLNNGHGVLEDGKLLRVWGTFRDITERKKMEEALWEQREKAQKYLDVAGVMFVVLDTNGVVTLLNKRGYEVLGCKEEDIIDKNWFDNFLPERIKDDVALVFDKLIAREIEPVKYHENPVMTKSGEERTIAWHNTILRDSLGNMTGFLSSGEDITERRQAEDKLRQSEERFKMLFESAPDAYYIHDLEGHFIDGNKAAEQLIGYSRKEVLGENFVNLDLVAEEDIPKVLAAMAENKDGKPAGPLELTIYRKDGSEVMVETRSYPVEIGGQTVVLGIARDITERKKAEVALRQSEQRLKILFQSAPDAIYLIDLKGNIIDGNKTAEKMVGYAEDELIGKSFVEAGLLSSEQLLRAIASLEKNAMGKPTGPDEFTLTRKDGSTVPVEIRTFPVRIGEQVLSLGIARDITARKKAEQELLEHRAQLKSLASELSLTEERERHRLATDLHDHISQALVFSRIKLQELHASVSSAEIAGPLGEACDNLEQIIQDTRNLTFDLSSPILYELGFEAAVSEWLDEQISRKHDIKTQFEDDGLPKPLEDDIRVLLFRNVRELLINIVKHAEAQNVKVSLCRIGEKICISVEDDGIGFNPSEVASKAGFGIFSIRERLEQLAGHLEIESEPGRGSKITMTAPLKCDEISRDDKIKT